MLEVGWEIVHVVCGGHVISVFVGYSMAMTAGEHML